MDSSVSPKDEIWFLLLCHHISNAVYHECLCNNINIFIVSKMHICSICDMSSCRILILVTVRLDGQNIRIFRLNESTARVQSYRRPPCIVLITYKQNKAGELASVTELHRCCRHATKHLTHLLWFACNTNSPFAFFSLWAVFPV